MRIPYVTVGVGMVAASGLLALVVFSALNGWRVWM